MKIHLDPEEIHSAIILFKDFLTITQKEFLEVRAGWYMGIEMEVSFETGSVIKLGGPC